MKNISIRALRLFTILLVILNLSGQPLQPARAVQPNPIQVADLNTTLQHSYPFPFLQAGEQAYFFTYNDGHTRYEDLAPRFYQTDGTPQGTRVVKSMGPGDPDFFPVSAMSAMFGGWLYFSVNDPSIGYTVARTDGSERGTTLVPMDNSFTEIDIPFSFLVFQEKLYFADAYGIWYLDDPDSTPQLLVETSTFTYTVVMMAIGDHFYFRWYDREHGIELWESDGTPAGTHFLIDIASGMLSSYVSLKTVHKGTLYFEAQGTAGGLAVWSYRPDQNQLTRLSNQTQFNPSTQLEASEDWVYFIKYDPLYDPLSGTVLCRTDGLVVEEISQLASSSIYTSIIGTLHQGSSEMVLFLMANNAGEPWLYANNGTAAGTVKLAGPFSYSGLGETTAHLNSKIFFNADDGVHGVEMWQTDGTPGGTGLMMDIYPGSEGSQPGSFVSGPFVCGSRLCFFADDGIHGFEPWGSDGTPADTQMLVDSNQSHGDSNPHNIQPSEGMLYFLARDGTSLNLYRTDHAAAGAELLYESLDLYPYNNDVVMAAMGDQLVFLEYRPFGKPHEYDLWWVSGPDAQPVKIAHLGRMGEDPVIEQMEVFNQRVFFSFEDRLWVSNGIPEETRVLYTLSSPVNFLTTFNNRLVFGSYPYWVAFNQTTLYTSDGISPSPTLIRQITGRIVNSAQTSQSLFLNLLTTPEIYALWQMDAATMTLNTVPAPACLGSYGVLSQLTGLGDTLFFLNRSSDKTRLTLLKTRGVQEGVECVWSTEITPDFSSPVDKPMTTFQGNVFFEAPTADGIQQVMMSDGTTEGTLPLPGQGTSAPGLQSVSSLLAGPDRLYFQASTPAGGRELWFWDGGEDLPRLAVDLNPGPASSSPDLLHIEDRWLYFSANDGLTGRELWAFDTSQFPSVSAEFAPDPSAGVVPLTVQFTSITTGEVDTFLWDFNDGTTSSEANPSHIFNTAGQYAVRLKVSGGGATDSITKTITVYNPVQAKFDLSPAEGIAPAVIQFISQSSGSYTTLLWDFGDGAASSEPNPSHTYQQAGSYQVQLTAAGPGGTDTITKVLTIYDPGRANFDLTPVEGIAPLSVQFTSTTTGDVDTFTWDFNDGTTSSEANPSHIFNTAGQFKVSLTVSRGGETNTITKTISVYDPVQAKFDLSPVAGIAPAVVQFNNRSSGSFTTLLWQFGDATTSGESNPSHTYAQAGTYQVQLTASGPGGTSTMKKTITVYDPVKAKFNLDPSEGIAPMSVQFRNQSSGSYTTLSWDFGDGATSSEANPSHTYTKAGRYLVRLTVVGPGGTDQTSVQITVSPQPTWFTYLPLLNNTP